MRISATLFPSAVIELVLFHYFLGVRALQLTVFMCFVRRLRTVHSNAWTENQWEFHFCRQSLRIELCFDRVRANRHYAKATSTWSIMRFRFSFPIRTDMPSVDAQECFFKTFLPVCDIIGKLRRLVFICMRLITTCANYRHSIIFGDIL